MGTQRHIAESSLLEAYRLRHDVNADCEQNGLPLFARAAYCSRSEKVILTQDTVRWTTGTYEYTFFFSVGHLTRQMASRCTQYALGQGLRQMHHHQAHMRVYATAFFLADRVDSDAVRFLQNAKFCKGFRVPFRGWLALRTVALEVPSCSAWSNAYAKPLRRLSRKIGVSCGKKAGDTPSLPSDGESLPAQS